MDKINLDFQAIQDKSRAFGSGVWYPNCYYFSGFPMHRLFMIKPYLAVSRSTRKGRGVFTRANIPTKTVIEISPVIVLSGKDTDRADKTILHNYIFLWGARLTRTCIALGYCSIYNHSFDPNCEYEMDFSVDTMTIKTLRGISKGEELTINYNGETTDQTPLWFKVKKS